MSAYHEYSVAFANSSRRIHNWVWYIQGKLVGAYWGFEIGSDIFREMFCLISDYWILVEAKRLFLKKKKKKSS